MADPSKADLDAVFLVGDGKGKPPPPPMDEDMPPPEDNGETEAALDASIDDIFAAKDPVARREAFKRAMRLCNESSGY